MTTDLPGHMDSAAFRRHGHAVVDWIADYLDGVEDRPVASRLQPGEVRAALPAHPPEAPEPFEAVMADLDELIVPGLTHWQHPGFFAYFPANSSPVSVLGELLSAGLGVQGMLWATSPAATELETHVLDWLAELLDLPAAFRSGGPGGGVIQDSASSATLCALLAARDRATGGAATTAGVDRPLAVYASEHAHSSVEKAVRIAGLGTEHLRLLPSDEQQRLRVDVLAERLAADAAADITPTMVVATVGTTSTGAVDPVRDVAEAARHHDAWVHVDAAWAGTAAVAPEHRAMHDGLELVDSYCTNPHKGLLVNFDCDAFYVADRAHLLAALSILPEYLRTAASESGAVIDYRDWQIPLGRRFRALKLWATIRTYGAQGLRAHVRSAAALAAEAAEALAGDPHLQLVAAPSLGLVCCAHVDGDDATRAVLDQVNADGAMLLTHTRVEGRLTIRLAIGGLRTEHRHVAAAVERLRAAAAQASGAHSGVGEVGRGSERRREGTA